MAADKNHTGKLSWSEFWNATFKMYTKMGAKPSVLLRQKHHIYKLFRKMAGRDGLLSWGELKAKVLSSLKLAKVVKKAKKWFRKADKNHTGKLTWSEYWNHYRGNLARKGFKSGVINRYRSYVYRSFKMMAGKDGLLSWREVKRLVTKHFK